MSAEDPSDVARLREAFASLAGEGSDRPVDAERIFDALHGNVSPEERQAVVDELLVNPAAAEAWRLAREMPAGAAPQRSTPPGIWKWMPVAAAAVLAVGVSWQLFPGRQVQEPAYRSVETRAIQSDLPSGAVLARAQPVLRWTGVEGARYRVRVLTPELEVLEESAETPAREYTVSDETLRRIPPGGEILWQIEARTPAEGIVVSPTFNIVVP